MITLQYTISIFSITLNGKMEKLAHSALYEHFANQSNCT